MKSQKIKILSEVKEISWYGVISQLKPYALVWAINSNLQISFKPGEYTLLKSVFPKYTYSDKFNAVDYTIFVNRIDSKPIFKDLKNADFLLKIEGKIAPEEKIIFFKNMKEIKGVRGIVPMATERLKKDKKLIKQI